MVALVVSAFGISLDFGQRRAFGWMGLWVFFCLVWVVLLALEGLYVVFGFGSGSVFLS